MSHQIILPRVMHIGKGASQRVAETLKGLNCHKPLLVTDKVMVELGYSAAIVQVLEEAGISRRCIFRYGARAHGEVYLSRCGCVQNPRL